MAATQVIEPEAVEYDVALPPTQDELPYSDGVPMESERHVLQMQLLMDTLRSHWSDRDVFIGGNMFVYFSLQQVRNRDFRGPDFFVVLDVPRGERKSWVIWEEGKGPDVVIELLSESTAEEDQGRKMRVYQDRMRVPEYYWYDPFSAELAGFKLSNRQYAPLAPDDTGRLSSDTLGLRLTRWTGTYKSLEATWLRFAQPDGTLLPTTDEQAEAAQRRAAELEARLARYRERFGDLDDTEAGA